MPATVEQRPEQPIDGPAPFRDAATNQLGVPSAEEVSRTVRGHTDGVRQPRERDRRQVTGVVNGRNGGAVLVLLVGAVLVGCGSGGSSPGSTPELVEQPERLGEP